MKHKLILIMAVIIGYSSLAFANFEKNFKKSIKEKVDIDVEIQLKKPLRSFDGQYFVIGRTANGNIFPVIVSTDGKHFVGLSSVMNFSKEDSKMIMDEINKAGEEKMKSDREALLKLFAEFKDYDFIALEGKTKNLPTKIVVTDPDCPYCRKHLEEIEKELESAHLKLIFAPVHEKEAFIKAQLILNAQTKAKTTKEKIALLRKYYKDIKLSKTEQNTDIKQVQYTTERILNSGLVEGVPFIFNLSETKE